MTDIVVLGEHFTELYQGGTVRVSTDMAAKLGRLFRGKGGDMLRSDQTWTFDLGESGKLIRFVGCAIIVDCAMGPNSIELPNGVIYHP